MKTKHRLLGVLALSLAASGVSHAQQQIVITSAKKVGEQLSLTVNASRKGVVVDWGDGKEVAYTNGTSGLLEITGQLKGKKVIVKGDRYFNTLICENQMLTDIDLSGAEFLRSIYCHGNQLTSVDFTVNPEIVDIDLSENKLTSVRLGNTWNTKLENINVSDNELRGLGNTSMFKLDVPALQHVNIANNRFTSVSLSSLPQLDAFIASNNRISYLDLRQCGPLTTLVVNNNRIRQVKTDPANPLNQMQQCLLDHNNITELDCSDMKAIKDLSVSDNNMAQLTLPQRTKFESYNCADNCLSFSSMPTKDYQPEEGQLKVFPQRDIDLRPLLKKKRLQYDNYYMDICPSYAQRTNSKYVLNADFIRRDANNIATSDVKWKAVDVDGSETELTQATYADQHQDYAVTGGKVAFFKPFHLVYASITNERNYPGVTLRTISFPVGEDNIIDGIETPEIEPQAPAEQKIYDLQGRVVTTPQPGQIYIINGKKVFVK